MTREEDAEKLLKETRERIDLIDTQLVQLISERTALAKDVIEAKTVLNMDILDNTREDYIHGKISKLAKDYDLDEVALSQIMSILTTLSKTKQQELLDLKLNKKEKKKL